MGIDTEPRTEGALDKGGQALHSLFASLPGVAYRCLNDEHWTVQFVSQGVEALTGYKVSDLVGNARVSFASLIHPEDRPNVRKAVDEALARGTSYQVTYRLRTSCGENRWMWERGHGVERNGGIEALEGFITDITEKQQLSQRLDATLEQMPHGFYLLDEDWRISFVNPVAEKLLRRPRERLLGRLVWDVLASGSRDTLGEMFREAREEQRPSHCELYLESMDEWFESHAYPSADGLAVYFRTISERKRYEKELETTNRALTLLSRCNEALIHAEGETDLLQRVCTLAVEIGGYVMSWAGYARDDAYRLIEQIASAGRDDGYLKGIRFSWSADRPQGQGPAGLAIRRGEPVYLADITEHGPFRPWLGQARQRGYGGLVGLPLRDGERTFGVLMLYKDNREPFLPEEQRLLADLAADVAFGLKARRAQDRERRLQQAVLRTSAAIAAQSDTQFFEQMAINMTAAVGADAGFLARLSPGDRNHGRTIAAVSGGKLIRNMDFKLEGTPCHALLESPEVLIADGLAKQFPGNRPIQELGARTYVGQRLSSSSGTPLGLLVVLFRTPPEDTAFVQSTLRILAAGASAELERQAADRRIRQQAELLEQTRDAILLTDAEDRIRYWNQGAERTFGWSAEEVIGRPATEVLETDPEQLRQATEAVLQHGHWSGELVQNARSGAPLVIQTRWSLSGDSGDVLQIGTDITRRKEDEARIQKLAYYDSTTGLPNRTLFLERLQAALQTLDRSPGQRLAVLFMDLNRFKEINDSQGHLTGDHVLREVAARFRSGVRQGETLARLGGDEFVFMAPVGTPADARALAERLLAVLKQPVAIGDQHFTLDASIGIALAPEHGRSPEALLQHTDIAMYQAKGAGGGHCLFESAMAQEIAERVDLAKRFAEALRSERLELHYQPQVNIATGQLTGAEALLRWHDPQLGWISPGRFIPIAEERRMMTEVGDWVMDTVCRQLADWRQAGMGMPGRVSLNIAAQQLDDDELPKRFAEIARSNGVEPESIGLELTETGIMHDPVQAAEIIQELTAAGFILTIDDFGTGYSSLSYLKRFPVNGLKIDLSFIRDMLVDTNDHAIVNTIIAMARIMGLQTLAEGVETAAQAQRLRELGCEEAQGYHFGRPVPPAQFAEQWLAGQGAGSRHGR